jgi:6,7-dimethyl-8-ribityllumazine synthase
MKKILIVTANYYPEISTQLESYAIKTLSNFDCKKIYSPGVFEIPVLISKNINFFDGFVALGCVIKGETPHFDFISSSVTSGIMQLSVQNKKPIGNGILTCLNKEQANARVKKGIEAAEAVINVIENVAE